MILQCQAAFVTLATANIDQLVAFYTQLFGIQPQPYWPNRYAEYQLPGLKLGIFQPKTDQQAEFNHQTATGMSLCLEVADLNAAIECLKQLGYPPPGEIMTASHGKEIYAYDPAGNRLILHQSFPAKT